MGKAMDLTIVRVSRQAMYEAEQAYFKACRGAFEVGHAILYRYRGNQRSGKIEGLRTYHDQCDILVMNYATGATYWISSRAVIRFDETSPGE